MVKRLKRLKSLLVERLNPKRVLKDLLGSEIANWHGQDEIDIYCCFHNQDWKSKRGKSPSLSININGKFMCHSPSCEARGSSVVNFYEQFTGASFDDTLEQLYTQYIAPTIPDKLVKEWHQTLLDSPEPLRFLQERRGLTLETIKYRKLGYDGVRIIIPIYDEFGFCVNVRRYDYTKKLGAKMISYKRKKGKIKYGHARIYPIDIAFREDTKRVIIAEGEWDALLTIQQGLHAVTSTGGAGTWKSDFNEYFRGKDVAIIYDVHDVNSRGLETDAGQIGAEKVAKQLRKIAHSVKVVQLPLKQAGGDLTDYWAEGYVKSDLEELIDSTPYYAVSKEGAEDNRPLKVRLDEASKSEYYFRPLEMECIVAGKDTAPYLPPKVVNVITTDSETDDKTEEEREVPIEGNKNLLSLVNTTQGGLHAALKRIFGITGNNVNFETKQTFSVEELRLIPAINLTDFGGNYVVRTGYYLGHGLESNRTYTLRGYTVASPDTQSAVHVLTEAIPAHDNIEKFTASREVVDRLRKIFTPTSSVEDHMYAMAEWLSRNITMIKQRPDLHIAVDLVFHSPLTFKFNGELIHKGWIEALIIGDTRCGKGYVAERLTRFYKLGEVVSGENCTFAGLVGGVQQNNNHWMITWGKIPLNDKRLITIDEVSAMSPEEIGRMSRIRSEGIAEIVKIQSEKTRARTRLLWLSNPRSGRPMKTYNHGVEAIPELMGSVEDISRFDFAMTVATAEVSSSVINSDWKTKAEPEKYHDKDFTNLILWIWSRTEDQVKFSEKATSYILKKSMELGKRYSSSIPLVQSENIRVKLAKISAAVAARCFSTKDGNSIWVEVKHVKFACKFLRKIYRKPSMAYEAYSTNEIESSRIKNEQYLDKMLHKFRIHSRDFVEGMLAQATIGIADICNFTACDNFEALEILGSLVRLKCLKKEEPGLYSKKPAFIQYLRNIRERYIQEEDGK